MVYLEVDQARHVFAHANAGFSARDERCLNNRNALIWFGVSGITFLTWKKDTTINSSSDSNPPRMRSPSCTQETSSAPRHQQPRKTVAVSENQGQTRTNAQEPRAEETLPLQLLD
jgi:hypothetical protein